MVFNQDLATVVLVIVIIWISGLSIWIWRLMRHYGRLTEGTTKTSLKEVLEEILAGQRNVKAEVAKIEETLARLTADGQWHVQRVGMVRFNPFADTGGAQSFTLALLDGKDNGIVMTSLYGRTGSRWYVKEVKEGKGKELELSNEEAAAIKAARQRDKKV